MSFELAIAFILFSVSISITPGAGNIALLGISSRYGFNAGIPFVLGNAIGIVVIMVAASAGLVSVLSLYPDLYFAMKLAGVAYLLYMAWGIATATMDGDIESNHSGVMSGVLIQLLNPKGWVASLTVFTQFINPADDYVSQVATIISVMVGIGVLCMLVWAYFGTVLQKMLQSPKQMRVINNCLGGSLAIVAVMMLGQAG